jgi:hypothetical protein
MAHGETIAQVCPACGGHWLDRMNNLFGRRCILRLLPGCGGRGPRWAGPATDRQHSHDDEALDYDLDAFGYVIAWNVVCQAVTSDAPEARVEGKAVLPEIKMRTEMVAPWDPSLPCSDLP